MTKHFEGGTSRWKSQKKLQKGGVANGRPDFVSNLRCEIISVGSVRLRGPPIGCSWPPLLTIIQLSFGMSRPVHGSRSFPATMTPFSALLGPDQVECWLLGQMMKPSFAGIREPANRLRSSQAIPAV